MYVSLDYLSILGRMTTAVTGPSLKSYDFTSRVVGGSRSPLGSSAFLSDESICISRRQGHGDQQDAHIARKNQSVAHRSALVLGVFFKVEIDIDGHSKVGCIGRNESPAICGVLIKLLLNVFRGGIYDMLFVCEKLCVVDQRFKFVFLHLFRFTYEDELVILRHTRL